MRRAQQWLREIEYPELIQWIRNCHLPRPDQLSLESALDTFMLRQKRESERFYKEREPLKIFQHFIYWSNLTVSGYARNIFPETVAIRDEVKEKPKASAVMKFLFGKEAAEESLKKKEDKKNYKERHRQMLLEVDVLKYEGKYEEAKAIKKQVKTEQRQHLHDKIQHYKGFVSRQVNGLWRGLDGMLDSDSENEDSSLVA